MATVSSIMNPTLKDIVDRENPDGSVAKLIEAAERSSVVMQDATFVKANDGDSHQTTIRTGIPDVAERRYNQGINVTKTTAMAVKEQLAMMEDLSSVDAALADKSGNAQNYRASERVGKMQAGTNWLERNFFYGSPALSPDTFMGIAPRYSSKSAQSASQFIDAGGTGTDNTSIFDHDGMVYPAVVGLNHGPGARVDRRQAEVQHVGRNGRRGESLLVREHQKSVIWHGVSLCAKLRLGRPSQPAPCQIR